MTGFGGEAEGATDLLETDLAAVAHVLEWVSAGIDMMSIVIILIGAVRFVLGFLAAEVRGNTTLRLQGIDRNRMELGRYILAGLELLIVSDIIHTALTLELRDLAFLGLLVLIRSMISFFLDREIQQIQEELSR